MALEGANGNPNSAASPGWIDLHLRKHPELSKTTLGRATLKRRNKRLELLELIAQKAIEYARAMRRELKVCHDNSYPSTRPPFQFLQGPAVARLMASEPDKIVVDMHAIATLLYAWKKSGGPSGIGAPNDHGRAIAARVWNEEAKAMGKAGARYSDGSDRANYRFEQLANGQVSTGSLLAHSAQCTDGPIAERMASARLALRRG